MSKNIYKGRQGQILEDGPDYEETDTLEKVITRAGISTERMLDADFKLISEDIDSPIIPHSIEYDSLGYIEGEGLEVRQDEILDNGVRHTEEYDAVINFVERPTVKGRGADKHIGIAVEVEAEAVTQEVGEAIEEHVFSIATDQLDRELEKELGPDYYWNYKFDEWYI